MAIGDNFNDVEMLGWAGHPVLMSNAPAELLEMAGGRGWRLTASNDQDGVARAVARALAGREEQPLAVSR
jgi:hydroxymethylpyrimidine pyrophosphatase-like HAD family hydrolase